MFMHVDTFCSGDINRLWCGTEKRLDHCQAWTVPGYWKSLETGEIIDCVILRSYNTYVALYFPVTRSMVVLDYWSPTTSKHVSKFAHLFKPDHTFYLYKRSDHTGYYGINGRLTTSQVHYIITD